MATKLLSKDKEDTSGRKVDQQNVWQKIFDKKSLPSGEVGKETTNKTTKTQQEQTKKQKEQQQQLSKSGEAIGSLPGVIRMAVGSSFILIGAVAATTSYTLEITIPFTRIVVGEPLTAIGAVLVGVGLMLWGEHAE